MWLLVRALSWLHRTSPESLWYTGAPWRWGTTGDARSRKTHIGRQSHRSDGSAARLKLTVTDGHGGQQDQQGQEEPFHCHVFRIPMSRRWNASSVCRYQHRQSWNTTTVWLSDRTHTNTRTHSQRQILTHTPARSMTYLKGRVCVCLGLCVCLLFQTFSALNTGPKPGPVFSGCGQSKCGLTCKLR